ncbi:MAG: hypothetical protein V1775_02490 [Bacteroidota bacterium]
MSVKNIYRLVSILLIIQVVFYIYSLFGRIPDIDDAWIGEHAYWMAKEGHVRSELMRGWTQQENRVMIHHKLLTLHGVGFIKMFGFSVYTLKAVSLLYFTLFLIAFYYYTRRLKKIFNPAQFTLAIMLIFTFHFVFKFSFLFRPEIMIMFLTFISFLLLEKIIEGNLHSFSLSLLSGILGGLCIVAHLNGVAVAIAGGVLLIWNRKLKELFIFSIGTIIGLSLYFYDFSGEYGFLFWKNQLLQSVVGSENGSSDLIIYMLNSFLKEHMRFFHDLSIIPFSLLFFTMLIAGFGYLKNRQKLMLQYTFLLWLFVALIFTQKSRQYILIYLPFMIIFLSLFLDSMINNRQDLASWVYRKHIRVLVSVFLLFYLISVSYYNIRTSREKFDPQLKRSLMKTYIPGNQSSMRIVAPMDYIFNEIEYFKSIQGERLYTTLQKFDKTIYGSGFLKKAIDFNIDYIVLSRGYRYNLGMENIRINDTLSGFRVIYYTQKLSILKFEPIIRKKTADNTDLLNSSGN